MVSVMAFVVVSRTTTLAMVRASSHTLTYTLRPSGLKARNRGGPAATRRGAGAYRNGPRDLVGGGVARRDRAGAGAGDVELPAVRRGDHEVRGLTDRDGRPERRDRTRDRRGSARRRGGCRRR